MIIRTKNMNTKFSDLSKYINVCIIKNNIVDETKKVSNIPMCIFVNLRISLCKNIIILKDIEITVNATRVKVII